MKKALIIIGIIIAVIVVAVIIIRRIRRGSQNPVNINPVDGVNQNPPDYLTENKPGYDAFMASCGVPAYGNSTASCNQAWCIAQHKNFTTWAQYKQWWNRRIELGCQQYPYTSGCSDVYAVPDPCKN